MNVVPVHASAVVVGEAGVLLRGAAGSGKSRLALALLSGATNAGAFAGLVGDDWIGLEACGGRLIASGHARIAGKIEQRGAGILAAAAVAAAVIRLVVDLVPAEAAARFPDGAGDGPLADAYDALGRTEILGLSLPVLAFAAAAAGSDLARPILHLTVPSGGRPVRSTPQRGGAGIR